LGAALLLAEQVHDGAGFELIQRAAGRIGLFSEQVTAVAGGHTEG
jgi:hypothetical protein